MMANIAATELENLINHSGRESFNTVLVESMQRLTSCNHCTLLEHDGNSLKPKTLISHGDLAPSLATECAELYDKYLYQQDPNTERLARLTTSGEVLMQRRLREDMIDHEYRLRLFDRCLVKEKVTIAFKTDINVLSLNFYRLGKETRNSPLQIEWTKSLDRCLGSVLQKHIDIINSNLDSVAQGTNFDREWISRRMDVRFKSVLTEREREVCAYILLGYTSESISLNLSISHNTVLSHRRNAYEKLNIGTQNQLFSLMVEGMLLPVV